MTDPEISVVVCTRNRSRLLARACAAILAVEPPAAAWELVMSAARNRGISAARGELLVFVDDDAFPHPHWLQALVDALRLENVQAAGGPIELLLEGEMPSWLSSAYLPYLSVWDLGPDLLDLAYNEYPRGANMAFRRSVFTRLGGFSPDLGRRGKSLRSCEETELCLRIERTGGRVVYVPRARVAHLTAAERITETWLLGRFAAQGTSEAIVDWKHGGWAGLRRGLRRFAANARHAPPQNSLLRRCQARSLLAYAQTLLWAPLRIRRWRPGPEVGPLKPWLPFA
jgi:glycosyltransferase involved in cell wall biosynthesis